MRLIYDISVMTQLVAACQTANDEIVKAQQQIQAVKSHADWTCKEKSVIDELMGECKNLINCMQEDQNGLLTVLKQVEDELDGAEKSISGLFQGVESILSKVLSIPAAVTTVVGGGLIGAGSGIPSDVIGGGGSAIQGVSSAIQNVFDGVTDWINPDTAGTGGWISNLQEWMENIQGIGSDISDDSIIWHGPGVIPSIDTGLFDTWQEVIGTGLEPVGVVGDLAEVVKALGIAYSPIPICRSSDIQL